MNNYVLEFLINGKYTETVCVSASDRNEAEIKGLDRLQNGVTAELISIEMVDNFR